MYSDDVKSQDIVLPQDSFLDVLVTTLRISALVLVLRVGALVSVLRIAV